MLTSFEGGTINALGRMKKRPFARWPVKDLVTFFVAAAIGSASAVFSLIQIPVPYNWPAVGLVGLMTLWITSEVWERVEAFKRLADQMRHPKSSCGGLTSSTSCRRRFSVSHAPTRHGKGISD